MSQTSRLLATLKKVLKKNGITYAELANRARLSEPTIKRMFAQESLTLSRFESLCSIAGITIEELVRLGNPSEEPQKFLTYEQDSELATDERLFVVFYLLLDQLDTHKIRHHFNFSRTELSRLLLRLDRIGLIDLHPADRVVLRVNKNIDWYPNGPLTQIYKSPMRDEFLGSGFDTEGEALYFLTGRLTRSSRVLMEEKISRLQAEIRALMELDKSLGSDETTDYALLIAHRPWTFSLFKKHLRPGKSGQRGP